MLKVSQLMRVNAYIPKRKATRGEGTDVDVTKLPQKELALVGQVRQVVFAPEGDRVVGLLLRRPDVAGMIKREDAFLALDSIAVGDAGLVATRGDQSLDDAARQRLGLDWDRCILWTGMDARTTDGKDLGWVADAEFAPRTGRVKAFYVGDGGVAEQLVGDVVIPAEMMRGYKNGYLVVDPQAAHLSLNGGLAARAGESYGRAKLAGKEAADKAGKAAGDAVEKGAFGLGRAIGKAKKTVKAASGQAASAKSGAGEGPSAKSGSATKKIAKQLGRTKGMFGAFMDEYKKASK